MECMEILHQMGCKTVVISSSSIGPDGDLIAFGSTKSTYTLYYIINFYKIDEIHLVTVK
jgi:hypothetical protein